MSMIVDESFTYNMGERRYAVSGDARQVLVDADKEQVKEVQRRDIEVKLRFSYLRVQGIAVSLLRVFEGDQLVGKQSSHHLTAPRLFFDSWRGIGFENTMIRQASAI